MSGRLSSLSVAAASAAAACAFLGLLWIISLFAMFGITVADTPQRVWDTASEGNVWTWGNVLVLIVGGVLHLSRGAAAWRARRRGALAWSATGAALLALSLDDLAGFHEALGSLGQRLGGGEGMLHFAWVVPGAALAAGFCLLIGLSARSMGRRPALYLLTGAGTLVAGALGLEMLSGAYLSGGGSNVRYALIYHAEEAVEALGAALLLAAAPADLRGETARLGPWLTRTPPTTP